MTSSSGEDRAWEIQNGDRAELADAVIDCLFGHKNCPLLYANNNTANSERRVEPVEPQPFFDPNAEDYHSAHDAWEKSQRREAQRAEGAAAVAIGHAGHIRLLLFLYYLANYTVMVYFNVAFAYIALRRLTGGNAKLTDGLAVARARALAIIQWAFLASTVGMVLSALRNRGELGRASAGLLGYGWRLGTYFVMPLLALENIGAGEAPHFWADLFRQKWGEVVIARFSFSLLFHLFAFPAMAFFFLAALTGQIFGSRRYLGDGVSLDSFTRHLLHRAGLQRGALSLRDRGENCEGLF